MTATFEFVDVFPAPSIAAIIDAYFDPDHLAAQDVLAGLGDRTVVEADDDGAIRRCTWQVRAVKPLPVFVRPFVEGGHLRYLESMTARRADATIDLAIKPAVLGGRVQIAAVYRFAQVGDHQIQRTYQGSVTVGIRFVSGKIERAVLAEIEKGMPVMAGCTKAWLAQKFGAAVG